MEKFAYSDCCYERRFFEERPLVGGGAFEETRVVFFFFEVGTLPEKNEREGRDDEGREGRVKRGFFYFRLINDKNVI